MFYFIESERRKTHWEVVDVETGEKKIVADAREAMQEGRAYRCRKVEPPKGN